MALNIELFYIISRKLSLCGLFWTTLYITTALLADARTKTLHSAEVFFFRSNQLTVGVCSSQDILNGGSRLEQMTCMHGELSSFIRVLNDFPSYSSQDKLNEGVYCLFMVRAIVCQINYNYQVWLCSNARPSPMRVK